MPEVPAGWATCCIVQRIARIMQQLTKSLQVAELLLQFVASEASRSIMAALCITYLRGKVPPAALEDLRNRDLPGVARDVHRLDDAFRQIFPMKSFLQMLYRIGNAMTAANVGNRFEFERLMTARREEDLAATRKPRPSSVSASCRPGLSRRLHLVAKPATPVKKRVRESMA